MAYKLLGWVVWQVGKRLGRRWAANNRPKVAAVVVIVLVLVGGIAAARADAGAD